MERPVEWLILGQGLAGTCLAFEFLERGIPLRIVDKGSGGSSRVAAGLINPITGRNFEPSWLIEEFHPKALDFYDCLEKKFGARFWNPLPVQRLARSEKEWNKISKKLGTPEIGRWLADDAEAPTPAGFAGSVILKGGGWLDTRLFLKSAREYFQQLGIIDTTEYDLSEASSERILCQGSEGLMSNQLGNHRCAKGEILTVAAKWPQDAIRIGAGGWLIPIGGGLFRIGSTYEWNQLDELPTEAGTKRISEIASVLGGPDFTVIEHVAGIRPILRKSQPLIGKNTDGDWLFNALGSKGTLYAPGIASMLADWISKDIEPDPRFIYNASDLFS